MNRNLKDGINILSKLDGKRLRNAFRLWISYYVSKWFNRPMVWGKPLVMEIEPTTSCNLRCPQCPSGLREFTRDTGMLNLELYKKVIDEVGGDLIYLILYFQGEPFLNRSFHDFVLMQLRKTFTRLRPVMRIILRMRWQRKPWNPALIVLSFPLTEPTRKPIPNTGLEETLKR